jgi:hypothetical protein
LTPAFGVAARFQRDFHGLAQHRRNDQALRGLVISAVLAYEAAAFMRIFSALTREAHVRPSPPYVPEVKAAKIQKT